jgi:hypothetical protein
MTQRNMGPLGLDHPLVKNETPKCPGCDQSFQAGDHVTLVTVGPGNDPESRDKRDRGLPYNAVALPVHWDCAEQVP